MIEQHKPENLIFPSLAPKLQRGPHRIEGKGRIAKTKREKLIMLDILAKLSELTKDDIPTDPKAQREYAIKLVNAEKIAMAQAAKQADKETLEDFLFRLEVLDQATRTAFQFCQLNLSKRYNVKFDKLWEPSEKTKAAPKVGYEPGTKKKAKAKKAKPNGDVFEKRGKSNEDRVIIDIAKGLLPSFKHLPESEALAAAFQSAKSHFEKFFGGKK